MSYPTSSSQPNGPGSAISASIARRTTPLFPMHLPPNTFDCMRLGRCESRHIYFAQVRRCLVHRDRCCTRLIPGSTPAISATSATAGEPLGKPTSRQLDTTLTIASRIRRSINYFRISHSSRDNYRHKSRNFRVWPISSHPPTTPSNCSTAQSHFPYVDQHLDFRPERLIAWYLSAVSQPRSLRVAAECMSGANVPCHLLEVLSNA